MYGYYQEKYFMKCRVKLYDIRIIKEHWLYPNTLVEFAWL